LRLASRRRATKAHASSRIWPNSQRDGAVADDAFARVKARTPIAKIMFTSGSTGSPKGVVTTNRMLCANQSDAGDGVARTRRLSRPVAVDWLPWSHVLRRQSQRRHHLAQRRHAVRRRGSPDAPGTLRGDAAQPGRDFRPTVFFSVYRAEWCCWSRRCAPSRVSRRAFFAKLRVYLQCRGEPAGSPFGT
jgi:feruloyl-CoA synthase